MFFVPAIRDYIEVLNNVFDSLSGNIDFQIIVKETLLYLFVSIKCILTYLLTFQWLRDVSYFPIIVPQLHSSVLNETYFLQNPVSTIFTFLETPTYGNDKFVLGFLNSFFFCLPISCAHVICARRLLIQGLPAGIASGLGTILGQWWFATCILFGLRSFIIPWFSFESLNFIVGFTLLLKIIYDMTTERSISIIKAKDKLVRIFLLNLILSWTEQCCIFQYFGNLTFGPEPTALEIFSSNTEIQSFLIDGSYLLGLLVGSFLFTGLFGFLSIRLSNFIYPLFKMRFSRWINLLNRGLIFLTALLTFTSIPYYGADYLFANPLGFIPQDQALAKTGFFVETVPAYKTHFALSDLSSFDHSRYITSNNYSGISYFEEKNFEGDLVGSSGWQRRQQFHKSNLAQMGNKVLRRALEVDPTGSSSKRNKKNSPTKKVKSSDEKESNSDNDDEFGDFDSTDSLYNRFGWINYIPRPFKKRLNFEITNTADTGFTEFFIHRNFLPTKLSPADQIRYQRTERIQKALRKHYYSNPLYKSLLTFQIDSLLSTQPTFRKLTLSEEKNLVEKRIILSNYYDSLRYYSQSPFIGDFTNTFGTSKSYANRVYNQQFKGTIRHVRRLFSISKNSEGPSLGLRPEGKPNKKPVLKFDQPLYLNSNESNYKPFHEELSHKKVRKTKLLNISNSTPFYAGWDQGLRKLVITNRLLPRSFAGDALYSPTKIKGKEYRTLANVIDSNKKIEFTTWPLSKSNLEKEVKSFSKIRYNLSFESLKDPQNAILDKYLNYHMLDYLHAEKATESIPKHFTRVLSNYNFGENFPPNKGGFIWPGNSSLKFNLVSKFKWF